MKKDLTTIKCKFYGLGGQGIKFLATTLGEIFHTIGYKYIAINSDYDTVVRGGKIEACTTASQHKINSPIVEDADICVILTDPALPIQARKYLVDSSLENILTKEELGSKRKVHYVNFLHNHKDFPANMLALKAILKEFSLSPSVKILKSALPSKNQDKNLEAILSN